MPDYKTNAPQGYCGDWSRGAPLGRNNILPETRTAKQLNEQFAAACVDLSNALALKEKRPSDMFKATAWQAAANYAREQKKELRALYKTAKEREEYSPKVTLRKQRLDSGGYDSQGAYFGIGEPLYWAATDDGKYDETFRAEDRKEAKEHVRQTIPAARFY